MYIDEQGNPLLKDSFCVFVDVLGFNKRVSDAFALGNGVELFDKFYKAISNNCQWLNSQASLAKIQHFIIKVFTDNIVLGYPLETDYRDIECFHIFDAIAEFQLNMALEGFFIRGGWSYGYLFMDENTVFGPAILEAHSLESKIAGDPRIVLSSQVLDMIKRDFKCYGYHPKAPQNIYFLVDTDGQVFLNYLVELVYETDMGKLVDWDKAAIHRDNIDNCLVQYKNTPHVWSKYFWLASYHNYFVNQYCHMDGFNEEKHIIQQASTSLTPIELLKII